MRRSLCKACRNKELLIWFTPMNRIVLDRMCGEYFSEKTGDKVLFKKEELESGITVDDLLKRIKEVKGLGE